jgi:DNA-binding transcriptional activator of the SARP family
MQTDYTDLFLLYTQRKMIDKYLHLLQQMVDLDPENPILYRALVRAYLSKGCPAHALQARERELQLGGSDPIRD